MERAFTDNRPDTYNVECIYVRTYLLTQQMQKSTMAITITTATTTIAPMTAYSACCRLLLGESSPTELGPPEEHTDCVQ